MTRRWRKRDSNRGSLSQYAPVPVYERVLQVGQSALNHGLISAGPIDTMGRAARLPTKESRVKWRGGNPPTNDCCTQRTASAQAAVRAKVLPNLIEPRAVRAAVKTASRLTVGLAASLDWRCARRSIDFAGRDGETGAQAEQRNLTLATRGFGRFQ